MGGVCGTLLGPEGTRECLSLERSNKFWPGAGSTSQSRGFWLVFPGWRGVRVVL